jgi:lipopolysaccharide/colanic/teichoic acid biosynthesis glycosyltransferase
MDNAIYSATENRGSWPSGILTGPAEENTADPLFLEGVLPQEDFLERLHFEKRRVDRIGNPLSMALFFLKEELLADVKKLREFLVSIKRDTRETDLKGWVKRNIFGLLMLDTDGPHAQKCVELLVNGRTKTVCDFLIVTYPDRLFLEILEKAEAVPEILPLKSLETVGDATVPQVLKRWLDILGALIGLVCFFPVLLITAIAIKLTSPGPIISRQTRLGRRGNHFDLLRFRSLAAGNGDRVPREYVFNLINGKYDQVNQGNRENPLDNLKNDSRISPVGKAIRKLGLDRLPQFFNVLKGEMSLVGPRPPIPHEVEKFKSWHLRRILAVKPGITGLWQVEGGSPISLDEMIRLDLRYVQSWSLWLDFKILGKTVLGLLMPQGPKRRPDPNDLSSNDAGGYNRILKAVKVVVQGTVIGLWLNYSWHHFLAGSLGWGDSAPDWYFRLQEIVFLGIMLIGLIGWVFFYPRLEGYLNPKKNENRPPRILDPPWKGLSTRE